MKHSIFMEKKNSKFTLLFIAFMALVSVSCKTTSKSTNVPSNASADEIIQMAQNAYDNSDRQLAKHYYTVLLQRYGMNTQYYIEGRFELAHLYLKEKNYERAVPMLEEIVEIYNASQLGALPGSFLKLAKLDLAKVPEKKMELIRLQQQKETAKAASQEAQYTDTSYDDYDDESYEDDDYSDEEEDAPDEDSGSDGSFSGANSRNGFFRF